MDKEDPLFYEILRSDNVDETLKEYFAKDDVELSHTSKFPVSSPLQDPNQSEKAREHLMAPNPTPPPFRAPKCQKSPLNDSCTSSDSTSASTSSCTSSSSSSSSAPPKRMVYVRPPAVQVRAKVITAAKPTLKPAKTVTIAAKGSPSRVLAPNDFKKLLSGSSVGVVVTSKPNPVPNEANKRPTEPPVQRTRSPKLSSRGCFCK